MKFYPCLIISKDELAEAGIYDIQFRNGKLANMKLERQIEDYCGIPVVNIRESTYDSNEIFVFTANGQVTYNPLTKKRLVVLEGNYDTLKVILSDRFAEHPEMDPYDIFDSYTYQINVAVQLELEKWVRNEI